jgi:hypothetical protein
MTCDLARNIVAEHGGGPRLEPGKSGNHCIDGEFVYVILQRTFQRSPALIFSSIPAPGHSSFSPSVFNAAS